MGFPPISHSMGKCSEIHRIERDSQFKAKYIKRRRVNVCNFIKNKEYKRILGKSMPPYINLSLFLIISSKNYISDPKILTKDAATVVFIKKVSQGSSFKKDSQFK